MNMKINDVVEVNGTVGRLIWKDNPWKTKEGEPADILVKVQFENGIRFHRLSELKPSNVTINKIQAMETKPLINYETFVSLEKQLEIRYGRISTVERVPKSTKMLKMIVHFGDMNKTVMTNIGGQLTNEQELVDREFPFIVNLEPAKIMGTLSEAMIMVPTNEDGTINFDPDGLENCKLL